MKPIIRKHSSRHLLLLCMGLTGVFAVTAAGNARAAEQLPSGDAVLQKVDQNRVSDSKIVVSQMIIHTRRGSRTVKAKSYIQGVTKSFTEYLDPPREQGVKMLKLSDQLWTYYPSTDRIILISGHMLRQSVMGSDLSYEDMMEDPILRNSYRAQVVADESFDGRPAWVLDLSATKEGIAYASRKLWVDKERFVPLKEERYAKSGKLLKTTVVRSVRRVEGRFVPDRVLFRDVLGSGEGTEFIIDSIEFDARIPETTFSKASLRR